MAEYNVQINKYNANNLGYDQLYPQPMKHADTHSLNGSDPINVGELGVSNRNILDNWYFGNPVDQRGGYVVPPGVVAYSDAALSIPTGGTTDMYYKIVEKTATYGRFVGNDSLNYYVAASACVRGYTGAGYGIDRWKLLTSQCTVTIDNDGITLHRNGGDQWIYAQPLEPEFVTALTGKSVVISTLTDAGLVELPVSSAFTAEQSMVSTSGTCIWLSTAGYLFLGTTADSVKLKAAKLELGSQQTIAHQENVNWQLNEIPDYGEQLARCQRYQWITNADNNMPTLLMYAATINTFVGSGQFPVTMRTKPAVTGVFARNVLTGETLSAVNNDSNNVVTNQDGVCYIGGMFFPLTVGGWYQVAAIFDANL